VRFVLEPYRIKVVEPLNRVTRENRKKIIAQAGYNPFLIPAQYVTIDLISDSGTGAMSSRQWAAMFEAREDFAGQKAYSDFVEVAQNITGLPYIQPVHQGRTAEHILFSLLVKPGDRILSNTLFATTRENIKALWCKPIDIPQSEPLFCGDIAVSKLNKYLMQKKRVKMVVLTMTNNNNAGQPISLDNIRQVRAITKRHKIVLVFDACRFADNAYLIKKYSKSKKNIRRLCRDMFDLCDIVYLSSKKDGLVNIGGFIGLRDKTLFEHLQTEIIRQESFPSSGGLAARDLEAMAVGLQESLDESFLRSYHASIEHLAQTLQHHGVKIFEPVGGHGVVVIPRQAQKYAAFSLAAQLYIETGIRTGIFGNNLRLAIPRRVYTKDHLTYVAESLRKIYNKKLPTLRITNRPKTFFNFFVRFKKT
jgi:tyrosine phenol-lyase